MSQIPNYSWSFSSLGLFDCPKRYEIIRAKKLIVEPPSKAGTAGSDYHELIENYLRDGTWHNDLTPHKRILDHFKEQNGICEAGYAFKWVPFNGDNSIDGYWQESTNEVLARCEMDDPDTWYRGYLDWMKIDGDKCHVVDWKTGKVKITKQLQLYAWVVFMAHPEVNEVKCTFHWINHRDQHSDWFKREQMEELFAPFREKLTGIDLCYTNDNWPENPGEIMKKTGRGMNCTYCHVSDKFCSQGVPHTEVHEKIEQEKF